MAPQHQPRTESGHRQPRRRGRQALQRGRARIAPRAARDLGIALGHGREEALLLGLFHREALDRADAGEHLGPAAEGGGPVRKQRTVTLRLLGCGAHADQRRQRREHAHRQGQAPVQLHQRRQRQAEIGDGRQRLERQLADRGDEAVDGDVDPVHQAADGVLLVEAERQLVQPRRDALAQAEVQVEPHAPAARLEQARQPHLAQLRHGDEGQGDEHQTHRGRRQRADRRHLRGRDLAQRVDQLHDRQRRRGAHGREQQGESDDLGDRAAEASQPGQCPTQQVARAAQGRLRLLGRGGQALQGLRLRRAHPSDFSGWRMSSRVTTCARL